MTVGRQFLQPFVFVELGVVREIHTNTCDFCEQPELDLQVL